MYVFPKCERIANRLQISAADPFFARIVDFVDEAELLDEQIGHAIKTLYACHDSLRMGVVWDCDLQLRLVEYDEYVPPLHIATCEDVRQMLKLRSQFLSENRPVLNLLEGKLGGIYYFREKSGKKALLRILCSHVAYDFLSYAVLRGTLDRIFMSSGPIEVPATFKDWLGACHAYAVGGGGQSEAEYWLSRPRALVDDIRQRTGSNELAAGIETIVWIAPSRIQSEWLSDRRREFRLLYYVCAAVITAASEAIGMALVPLKWTGHGRQPLEGRSFVSSVGWHADDFPIEVAVDYDDLSVTASRLCNAVATALNGGATYAWVAHLGDSRVKRHMVDLGSPFRINARRLPKSGSFAPAATTSMELQRRRLERPHKPDMMVNFTVDWGDEICINCHSYCTASKDIGRVILTRTRALLLQEAGQQKT